MADQDRDGPSLELPSFGFRRKRGKKARAAAEAESVHQPEPSREPEPVVEPEPGPTPQPEPTRAEASQADPTQAEPTQAETAAVPQPEPTPEPETEPIPVAREISPEQPAASAEPSGQPLFADETPATATTVAATDDRVEPETEERKKPRKSFRLPIGAIPGAVLTGILVGAATVGVTWGSLQICEIVRGASSCGGTGLFVLLLILVAMVFLGAGLLRFFGVADAGSTSFLAVGLLTVVVLLFLVDLLFNWWMIIVIPCVTLLTYTLSAWVTTSFVDTGRD
ncbi:MAG: hypothetical protein ACRDOX_12725 [Nocardioides sp.]